MVKRSQMMQAKQAVQMMQSKQAPPCWQLQRGFCPESRPLRACRGEGTTPLVATSKASRLQCGQMMRLQLLVSCVQKRLRQLVSCGEKRLRLLVSCV